MYFDTKILPGWSSARYQHSLVNWIIYQWQLLINFFRSLRELWSWLMSWCYISVFTTLPFCALNQLISWSHSMFALSLFLSPHERCTEVLFVKVNFVYAWNTLTMEKNSYGRVGPAWYFHLLVCNLNIYVIVLVQFIRQMMNSSWAL